MERGYGTGVVPELVPDLLFWLAPIYLWCYNNVGFLRFPASSSLKQFWHPYGFTKGPGNHHLPFCNCKMAPMQAIIDLVSTIHPGSLYIYIYIYLSNLSNLSIYLLIVYTIYTLYIYIYYVFRFMHVPCCSWADIFPPTTRPPASHANSPWKKNMCMYDLNAAPETMKTY